MRSTNKSRSRNKNHNRRPNANIVNRVFDSSGPEGKVRGTPQQIVDKYQSMARDAHLNGDRVAAENFLQHSEHYSRMLVEAQREATARREQHEAQQAQQAQHSQRRDPQNQPSAENSASNAHNEAQPDLVPSIAVEATDSGLVDTPENNNADKPAKTKTKAKVAVAENRDKPAKNSKKADPAPDAEQSAAQ